MYYVIQVKTGNEDKTIEEIQRFNTNTSSDFEIFTPSRQMLRKIKGEYKTVTERCFPGYIFVKTDDPKKLFYDLYWVPEFTKLLGREDKSTYFFNPLREEEERMIDILYRKEDDRSTAISDIEVQEGDKIRILNGPLRDMEGFIKKTNFHKRKVIIEIPLFNRMVEVSVGIKV